MASNNINQGKNQNKGNQSGQGKTGKFSNENDLNQAGNKNVQGNAGKISGSNMSIPGQNAGTNMGNTGGTAWGGAVGLQKAGANTGNLAGTHPQGSTLTGQVDNPAPGNIGGNAKQPTGQAGITGNRGGSNQTVNKDADVDATNEDID